MTTTYSFCRKGFTLVELLLVIVIMITLASGVLLVAGDSGDSQTANLIISKTRTLKAAAMMYKRDHFSIPDGAGIDILEPYTGSPVNDIEGVTYSFAFGENGETYLQVDLSGVSEQIKTDLSDMADENLFYQPSGEVSRTMENSELLAYLSPSSVLGYFAAKPAYAKKQNNGNGNGNAYAYGHDNNNGNGNNGNGNSNGNGNGNGNTNVEEQDENAGSADDQPDSGTSDQNQSYEDYEENTTEDTGDTSDSSSDSNSSSVEAGGLYSGGNTILVRI